MLADNNFNEKKNIRVLVVMGSMDALQKLPQT